MRVLFDNGTLRGVGAALTDHIVEEARAHGWDTLRNGELLDAAEAAGFDVFVTTDRNLRPLSLSETRHLFLFYQTTVYWDVYVASSLGAMAVFPASLYLVEKKSRSVVAAPAFFIIGLVCSMANSIRGFSGVPVSILASILLVLSKDFWLKKTDRGDASVNSRARCLKVVDTRRQKRYTSLCGDSGHYHQSGSSRGEACRHHESTVLEKSAFSD
jgi:hypothetical protein